MEPSAWGLLGVIVAQVGMFAGLVYTSKQSRQANVHAGQTAVKVDSINQAVNHQPNSEPTLIQRVIGLQECYDRFYRDLEAHRLWEHEAFIALAEEVGIELPVYPAS